MFKLSALPTPLEPMNLRSLSDHQIACILKARKPVMLYTAGLTGAVLHSIVLTTIGYPCSVMVSYTEEDDKYTFTSTACFGRDDQTVRRVNVPAMIDAIRTHLSHEAMAELCQGLVKDDDEQLLRTFLTIYRGTIVELGEYFLSPTTIS